jgi:predicted O-linked N-acetylglucosamine transferase (SPINDLY family)
MDLKKLALKTEWEQIIHLTDEGWQESVSTGLWRIKALRAQCRGNEADECLKLLAEGQRTANLTEAIELAEQLVQAAFMNRALPIIKSLQFHNNSLYLYFQAYLDRELGHYKTSLDKLDKITTSDERIKTPVFCSRVHCLLKLGEVDQAESHFARIPPSDSSFWMKLRARIDMAKGDLSSAIGLLNRAAISSPFDWEWMLLKSLALVGDTKQHEISSRLVTESLIRQPRNAEALQIQTILYLKQNELTKANASLNQSLRIKPWEDTATTFLIDFLIRHRGRSDAINALKGLISKSETPIRLACNLDLLRQEKSKSTAIKHILEKLRDFNSYHRSVQNAIVAARLAIDDKETAEELLLQRLSQDSSDSVALNNFAVLMLERKEFEQANLILEQLLLKEKNVTSLINLFQSFIEKGDREAAKRLWNQYAEIFEGSAKALQLNAKLHLATGNSCTAHKLIADSLKKDPGDYKSWLLLSEIELNQDSLDSAYQALARGERKVIAPLFIRKALINLHRQLYGANSCLQKIRHWQTLNPIDPEYFLLEANEFEHAGRIVEAKKAYLKVIEISDGEYFPNYLRFLTKIGESSEAADECKKWISKKPDDLRRHGHFVELLHFSGRTEDALSHLDSVINKVGTRQSLIRQRIGLLNTLEKYDESISTARSVYDRYKDIQSLSLLIKSLQRQEKYSEVHQILDQLIIDRPNNLFFKLQKVENFLQQGESELALQILVREYQDSQENETLTRLLIRQYIRSDQITEARDLLRNITAKTADRPDQLVELGSLVLREGLIEEADSIAINLREAYPDFLPGWLLGLSVAKRKEEDDEERDLWKHLFKNVYPARWMAMAIEDVIRLGLEIELEAVLNSWRQKEPHNSGPWWFALNFSQKLKRWSMSLELLKSIESREGLSVQLCLARAGIFSELWELEKAVEECRKAINLDHLNTSALEYKIGIDVKSGHWETFEADLERFRLLASNAAITANSRFFFNINCHPNWTIEKIYQYYLEWGEKVVYKRMTRNRRFSTRNPLNKLRIGYLSPDFRDHVVAKFTLPIIENHRKEDFEIYGYSNTMIQLEDNWTKKFKAKFDKWRNVSFFSQEELDRIIREDRIDILVDLAGHTSGTLLPLFERRSSPIQVSHTIGAGQTTGMPCTDFLLTSEDLWPIEYDDFATEKIIKIKHPALVYALPLDAPPSAPLPCLFAKDIVFAVVARPLRVHRAAIKIWAEILRATPNSKLRFEHIAYKDEATQARYLAMFRDYGILADRIQFCNTRPYWTVFHTIDIQLDPFPVASGSTATEALYMERLTITMAGRPAMGRTTAMQLKAVGLGRECVATSVDEYIKKATFLANNREHLRDLSTNLREKFVASPICAYKQYADELASAYQEIAGIQ